MNMQLAQAENRLSLVEQCDCQKSCRSNGTLRADGTSWHHGCDICTCVVRE